MRRTAKFLLVPVLALVMAACGDAPSGPDLSQFSAITTAGCTATLTSLKQQAQQLFGQRAPSFNSVRGKLDNMDHHLRRGQTRQAQDRAHEIVEFVLDLHAAGRLSGTDAQVTAFVNAVYCFAGIDIVIDQPDDTWFILPSDQPQVLYGLDSTVGISLPANPVGEPSLLRIEAFDGQLNTKLDQYPGFIRITLLNDGGSALTGRATVTVCAAEVLDPVVASRLRLGHGIRDTGFVITPEPTSADPAPANVVCEESTPGLFAKVLGAVRGVFAPKSLQASSTVGLRRFGGGVSGTVTEFSPFAPIDPVLSFGGGVSGTVTEFSRDAMLLHESLAGTGCETMPVGTDLPASCQPVVTVRTFNGTLFQGVPVDWSVASDALGRIAARSGNLDALSCGPFGTTAATTTSLNGNAGICWQLGGVGLNEVVARARPGGDAPEGVTFANGDDDEVTFSVHVTSVSLEVVSGDGALVNTGVPTPASVRAVDGDGAPVAGVAVHWTATGGSVAPATAVTGADGLATVSWTMGVGTNTLTAVVRNAPASAVTLTGIGKVPGTTAGLPSEIVVVSGDAQSGASGAPLAAPLVVRVTDNAGVATPGITVHWQLYSGSGTLSAATSVTDANGLASITFSPGTGTNAVKAFINIYAFDYVYFTSLTGLAP